MAIVSLQRSDREKLISKDVFDKVGKELSINEKPSVGAEGLTRQKTSDSADIESKDEKPDKFILADPPNLYKQIGEAVSEENFLKLMRSDYAKWLIGKHPWAYLLLNLIALRAMRIPDSPTGLKVGEAFVGDHESIGATRGQYRHALKVLVKERAIEIIENCRNRQKATTGTTTVGTKVKLLDTRVWDINPKDNNHRNDHPTTTERPPNNHEEEYKEGKEVKEDILSSIVAGAPSDVADAPPKKKKDFSSKKRKKVEPVPLIERDKGVFTSEISHKKLIEEKGSEEVVKRIYSEMAIWKAEKGVDGGNDYKTALNWSISPKRPQRSAPKPESYYPKDTTPSNPKKFISFAKEV